MRKQINKLMYQPAYKIFEELKQVERSSKEQIDIYQQAGLKKLIFKAYKNVSYYKNIIEKHNVLDRNRNINLNNFANLPFLTKNIIRKKGEDLVSKRYNIEDLRINTSGGSTGEPVRIYQPIKYLNYTSAVKMLFNSWTGYSLGMPHVKLWGSERDLMTDKNIRTKIIQWLRNEYWLNSFKMSQSDMKYFIKSINNKQPVQILSYASSIYDLAEYIDGNNLQVYSPKAIMTSAGTLYPYMRKKIEKVFNCNVYNRYGSREVADIACENEAHTGLYIPPTFQYVEIVKEDGSLADAGEEGEIVITNLINDAMPLIRYKIGDKGILGKRNEKDDLNWPKLKMVLGRNSDTFITSNGSKISGNFFVHFIGVVHENESIRKFQIIQKQTDEILVKVVIKNKSKFLEAKKNITDSFKKVMGEKCEVNFQELNSIPAEKSGKYRFIKSLVE